METKLKSKMNILKNIDTDDSRFLYRICIAYNAYMAEMQEKKENIKIEISNTVTDINNKIINLDDIWSEPYFNTKMRMNIERMVQEILNTNDKEFLNNKNICKSIIYRKGEYKEIKKESNKIDIVELVKILDKKEIKEIKIIAKSISDENIFKYEELSKAIEIININDIKQRNEIIYDYIYNYLNKDFIANDYCDFRNDKCVAQRHFNLYPISRKDGCCFTQIRKCPHLEKGKCDIECIACRLFSCPYLTKRGVGYWANEFVLLNAFLNKKQRKHLIFDFYQSKENILSKI